ncbi:TPA: oleate-activated transcription factor pip2 [Trebouxia sp. C0005]
MWTILEPCMRPGGDRRGIVPFIRAIVAELIGTAIFVFFSTATVTSGCHTSDVAADSGSGSNTSLTNVTSGSCFLSSTTALLNIALAFGFTIFVVIFVTAPFSGGHINPAVSFAFFLAQKISLVRGICYIIVQCAGAAIASIILKGLDSTGYKAAAGASNQINHDAGATIGRALGFEIILTFAFVFVIMAATDSVQTTKTISLQVLAPLAIGMTLFVCHLIAIPVDGCSVNPARSFGPAVVSRTFHEYWIFWVGPLVGAACAAAIYQSFKARDDDMRIGHIGNRHKSGKLPEDSAAGHDLEAARLNSLNNGTEAGKPVTHARAPGHAHGPSVEAGMPVTHVPHFQTVV